MKQREILEVCGHTEQLTGTSLGRWEVSEKGLQGARRGMQEPRGREGASFG